MKSKNFIYIMAAVAIVALLAIFLSSRSWLPDDRKNMSVNHDQAVVINAADTMLLTSAKLDTYKNEASFELQMDTKKYAPFIIVYFDGNKNKEAKSVISINNNSIGITVAEMPSEFYYYITIDIYVYVEGKQVLNQIIVDYRDITTIDSRNIVYITVTPTPSATGTPTPSVGNPGAPDDIDPIITKTSK